MDIKDQDRFGLRGSLFPKGGGVPMGPSAPLSSAASRYFVGDIVSCGKCAGNDILTASTHARCFFCFFLVFLLCKIDISVQYNL